MLTVKSRALFFKFDTQRGIRLNNISNNFVALTAESQEIVKNAITKYYHNGNSEEHKKDLYDHLQNRLVHSDRECSIPWLNHFYKLENASLLEIGCGTGSSTLAYAEQKAKVKGIDIDEKSLKVAQIRCNTYGFSPVLKLCNAREIESAFPKEKFDIIVFHASLEHMTIQERITSLKEAWKKIETNGILVIIETPNRLWFKDSHTSLLNFFHWLPDELAFEYSRFSPRKGFNDIYYENTPEKMEHFLRRGRGVSYHEFQLALEEFEEIKMAKSLQEYLREHNPRKAKKLDEVSAYYIAILKTIAPNLAEGFFYDYLDLIFYR